MSTGTGSNAADWSELVDVETGEPRYYNETTRKMQSTPPEGWEASLSRKRGKTNLSEATFSAKKLVTRSDSDLLERDVVKCKVVAYLEGCAEKSDKVFDKLSGKFSLMGASGVKGIGKTELLAQICEKWAAEASKAQAKAVYISYNGGGSAGSYCVDVDAIKQNIRKGHWIDSLGHLLLVTHGVDEEDAVHVPFPEALDFVSRNIFGTDLHNISGQLVICVDEIVHLDVFNGSHSVAGMTLAQKIMSECMGVQDDTDGKVVFIFTAILQSVYNELNTKSGREVLPLPLSAISLSDVFHRVISPTLRHLAEQQPAVNQLILSCAGHPRATVDGLPLATREWRENDVISTARLIVAREEIVGKCKFNLSYINPNIIQQWFCVQGADEELREELLNSGILHSFDSDVQCLSPLLLQQWALKNKRTTYGHHLSELFDADLILDSNAEKFIEAVMYHYEAILRKSMEGKEFDLKDFYRTGAIGDNFRHRIVVAKVPPAVDLVRFVRDFTDMDDILRQLEAGFLVVSNLQNEIGVEYLSPYHEAGTLVVACVQCKFVQGSVNWSDIRWKIRLAVKELDKRGIGHFPVLYTTADQKTVTKATCADGVSMIERNLFEFTTNLGVLRLHTQKLGAVLARNYPFLKGAGLRVTEQALKPEAAP